MPGKSLYFLIALLCLCLRPAVLQAQMDPYFTAINSPTPKGTLMTMFLPDVQVARSTNNFATIMGMAEYGITSRWTAGFMLEGQKISGLPFTFGGVRFNTHYHLLPRDHLLNFTVYGEYEHLNQAALYKMEVSGFGGEDLNGPLDLARRTPAHTFEQRAIMYHDWGRLNVTFNFVSETNVENWENDFGYVWGVFRQPKYAAMAADMADMTNMKKSSSPPVLSTPRIGAGLEMMGGLGDTNQFGFDWQRQQQYVGPVFSYELPKNFSIHVEPTFGLSDVSDPFILRLGVGYEVGEVARSLRRVF